MSDLVGNPEDRFSQNEAHIVLLCHSAIRNLYTHILQFSVLIQLTPFWLSFLFCDKVIQYGCLLQNESMSGPEKQIKAKIDDTM